MRDFITVKNFSVFVNEHQNGMVGKSFFFAKDILCAESNKGCNKNQVPLYRVEKIDGENVQCFCLSFGWPQIKRLSEFGDEKIVIVTEIANQ